MAKIHVVVYEGYEGGQPVGVFSTDNLAQEYVQKMSVKKDYGKYGMRMVIRPLVLDEEDDIDFRKI